MYLYTYSILYTTYQSNDSLKTHTDERLRIMYILYLPTRRDLTVLLATDE